MKQNVAERSLREGFSESRLPEFSQTEIQYIKGTYDFFGLNHYSTKYATKQDYDIKPDEVRWNYDTNAYMWFDDSWEYTGSMWCRVSLETFKADQSTKCCFDSIDLQSKLICICTTGPYICTDI